MSEDNPTWRYFGCVNEAGHYLFDENMKKVWGPEYTKLSKLDGLLPSQADRQEYVATFSRLDGWGVCAIAFWDCSVDNRAGSNSAFFVDDLGIPPSIMFEEAQDRFPSIFKRLPKEVVLSKETKDNPTTRYEQYSDPERD
jgi:hypothetical protein